MDKQPMKALTVRQPWAWAIFHAGKDIENRDWALPRYMRGQVVAIHSAKGMTRAEYEEGREFIENVGRAFGKYKHVPPSERLLRGHILGTVRIIGCVTESASAWFMGEYGFVLSDAKLLAIPLPVKGALGFWDVLV